VIVATSTPPGREYEAVLRDVLSATDCRVLLIGPVDDPQAILGLLRQGGDEYLDIGKLEGELREALLRFRAASREKSERSKSSHVIAVAGACGGVGTSLIATNVGVALAQLRAPCALIDLSFGSGDLESLLNLESQHSLADFCEKIDRVDTEMFQQFFAAHKSQVRLMSSPRRMESMRQTSPRAVRQMLVMTRASFPNAIIDIGRALEPMQREVMLRSDLLLLVTRLDIVGVRNARRLVDMCTELGFPEARLSLVANRDGQKRQLSRADVERALGMRFDAVIPDDVPRVNQSVNEGQPLVVSAPKSPVAKQLISLASEIGAPVE
jgi:pilus assembly protein CpaE